MDALINRFWDWVGTLSPIEAFWLMIGIVVAVMFVLLCASVIATTASGKPKP